RGGCPRASIARDLVRASRAGPALMANLPIPVGSPNRARYQSSYAVLDDGGGPARPKHLAHRGLQRPSEEQGRGAKVASFRRLMVAIEKAAGGHPVHLVRERPADGERPAAGVTVHVKV